MSLLLEMQVHKITIVSLCDSFDKHITCFILRKMVTKDIKMPKSRVNFLVHHEYRFFIVPLCFVLKEVQLYDPTIIKFVQPKKCNTFTAIYSISVLKASCDYVSVHKNNFYSEPCTIHGH